MRIKPIKRAARERALVDAYLGAYYEWRLECIAVRTAYRRWVASAGVEKSSAFDAYGDALDREERAAKNCARARQRAGDLPETGRAHQLVPVHVKLRAR